MPELGPNEHLIKLVRKHWFYIFKESIPYFFAALAPILLVTVFEILPKDMLFPEGGAGISYYLLAAVFLWFLFITPFYFVLWTDYYLDILVLTDHRVIEIEQKALFSREISSFRLERVQDVTIEVHGIIATLLHYGTIRIQTAGEVPELRMTYVPNPQRVKDWIMHELDRVAREEKIVHLADYPTNQQHETSTPHASKTHTPNEASSESGSEDARTS